MIQPITDRTQIDAALASFIAALREAGLDERADAIERASSDLERIERLGTCMSGVEFIGRRKFLYNAAVSLADAYGGLATAARELSRATAAIERYRGNGDSR